MVEFDTLENASKARTSLHGCDIYNNCCTMKVGSIVCCMVRVDEDEHVYVYLVSIFVYFAFAFSKLYDDTAMGSKLTTIFEKAYSVQVCLHQRSYKFRPHQ